jgi:hypothetical protein
MGLVPHLFLLLYRVTQRQMRNFSMNENEWTKYTEKQVDVVYN